MKTCPKCQAVNKDENRMCSNCQTYLGNSTVTAEDSAAAFIEKEERRAKKRRFLPGLAIDQFNEQILLYKSSL